MGGWGSQGPLGGAAFTVSFLILFVLGKLYSLNDSPASEDFTLTRIKYEISSDSQICSGMVGMF